MATHGIYQFIKTQAGLHIFSVSQVSVAYFKVHASILPVSPPSLPLTLPSSQPSLPATAHSPYDPIILNVFAPSLPLCSAHAF